MDLFDHDLGFEGGAVEALLHGIAELGIDGLSCDTVPSLPTGVVDHKRLLTGGSKATDVSIRRQSPYGLLAGYGNIE